MAMIGLMVVAVLGGTGCEKDTDCKGDRVCENNKCVAPVVVAPVTQELSAPPPPPPPEVRRVPLGSAAPCREPGDSRAPLALAPCPAPVAVPESNVPPPPPPPQEEKRVPLGAAPQYREPLADTCEQPLDADGRLKPECRVKNDAPPVRSRKNRRTGAPEREAEEEPAARAVGLLGVMYGVLIGGGAAVPAFAFTGAAGVRFRSGIGFVGVAHGLIVVSPVGTIQMYGFGPGIRFGNRTQLTLAVTGTFGLINVGTIHVAGGLFSLLAQVAIVIGDHFTLLAQPTIYFDSSGLLGSITGGIGVTF